MLSAFSSPPLYGGWGTHFKPGFGMGTGGGCARERRQQQRCTTASWILGGCPSSRHARARAPGIEPMTKKGLRDRNSPTCTLSQNGYGDILGQVLRLPLWPGGVTCMTRPATHKVVRAFGCGFRIKRCFRCLCIHLRLQQLHILL